MTQRLPVGPAPSIEALRRDVRARFKRVIDLVFLIGAALLFALQLNAARTATELLQLLPLPLLVIVLATGVLGVTGRAAWSPLVYIATITATIGVNLVAYGPLAGAGAMTVIDITLGFVFLPPRWRWRLIGLIALTPLAIGGLLALRALPSTQIRLADPAMWPRVTVALAVSLTGIAVIVRVTVARLRAALADIQGALAKEREAERERAAVEQEIAHARRADLIVELAAEVGADIGAALAAITAHAEALAAELTRDEARSCLADVVAAAATAGSTMRSLTVLNAEVAGPDHRSDAGHAARELPRIVRRLLPTGVALEIAADLEAFTPLSGTDLLRILSNLVLNARDAITGRGTIHVGVTADEERVLVEVRDDGHGMDADTQARVFQAFFTTKAIGRGTGLGLTTAKILVERAGGSIELVSAPGRGTTFRLVLPRHPAPTPPGA